MRTEQLLSGLLNLIKSPLARKTIGQILLRFGGKASPFFAPLQVLGTVLAVVAAVLVALRDQIFPVLGLTVPPYGVLIIEIVGWVSATIASMSALTLDEEGVANLNAYLAADE